MNGDDGFVFSFIGGSGRCGTSVLKRAFAAHPGVFALPIVELRLLNDPGGLVDFYSMMTTGWTPYRADDGLCRLERLLRDLGGASPVVRAVSAAVRRMAALAGIRLNRLPYQSIGLRRFCPEYDSIAAELFDDLGGFTYEGTWIGSSHLSRCRIRYQSPPDPDLLAVILRRFVSKLVYGMAGRTSFSHFIDDDPFNILSFPVIRRLLPEARLVHIVRDPRDVVTSYIGQVWAPGDLRQAITWYRGVLKAWRKVEATLDATSFITVRLEDLAADTEPVLRRITAFWGIPWHDSLLGTSFNQANTGRWRTDLATADQRIVRDELQDELRDLGYGD